MRRYGLMLGTLICLSGLIPVKAAPVSAFEGKPAFAEGEGRGYYVWRDGNTWHLRWTTFGATHQFTGSVIAEGGKIESLKLARTELNRQLEAATHPARKIQLSNAISEIDRQIAAVTAAI